MKERKREQEREGRECVCMRLYVRLCVYMCVGPTCVRVYECERLRWGRQERDL